MLKLLKNQEMANLKVSMQLEHSLLVLYITKYSSLMYCFYSKMINIFPKNAIKLIMTRIYPMSSQAVHFNSYDVCVFAKTDAQKVIGYL